MKKIHHTKPILRQNIRMSEDIQRGLVLAHLIESDEFPSMSFDVALQYLRKNTKTRIHLLRRILLDTYQKMGIVIDFNNIIYQPDNERRTKENH